MALTPRRATDVEVHGRRLPVAAARSTLAPVTPNSWAAAWQDRLVRALHDANTALARMLGWRARTTDIASDATSVFLPRRSERTIWNNPLEQAFHGDLLWSDPVSHEPRHLRVVRDALVTGSEAFVYIDTRTRLLTDLSHAATEDRKIRRPMPWLARRVRGDAFHISGRGTGNRAHFIVEHLPRLVLARHALGPDLRLRVLLTIDHDGWQREFLELLRDPNWEGVPGHRGTLRCERLVYAPNLSATPVVELAEPWVYLAIRDAMRPRPATGRRALFFSRRDAPGRRLVNEDTVIDVCRRHWPDIEAVQLDGRSVREQIELAESARAIVGPHGQAFHLSLFCRDALVVQLVSGTRTRENPYAAWATNFERLGMTGGNRCVSLYSGDAGGAGDWSFAAERLDAALERVARLPEAKA